MARRRHPRRRTLLALAALTGLGLAGCVMQPQVQPPAAREPAPQESSGAHTSDAAPEGSRWGAAPRRSGDHVGDDSARHADTPPRHDLQPIWPAGELVLPSALGGYRHVGEITEYSEHLTALYTLPDYRMLSATVSSSYDGYNARLRLYDNLQYVGDAVCGTDSTQSETDIAWRTCFVVAADGFVSLTAYSTSGVNTTQLAQLTEELYAALAADAGDGSL